MALLKSHNHEDDAIKGIGVCQNRVIAQFFTNDPLVAGNETTDNKPGRSIPSMFARMIFFRTAFESVVSSNKIKIGGNDPIPVYQRMVSLCLDVLYLVYKRDSRLTIERWNFADQTAKLGNNPILKEALETQRNTYLLKINNTQTTFQVDDIYLFFLNGELIGGTSPFTFAFSAPDWKGLGKVLALSQRDEDFREYVYKLYCSYRSNEAMSEFMSYVALCKKTESVNRLRLLDPALVTEQILATDYSQYDNNDTLLWVSQIPEIKLYAQKPEDFSSDFFINSPLQGGVDALNTPLFLCDGYHQLLYAKKKYWKSDIKVNDKPASDRDDKEARELPGYSEEKHIWLSVNDFLEQDLLKLPYKIDTTKFHAIVAANESYLLPLRPLFFKFFGIDDVEKVLKYEIKDGKCLLTLTIPVTNIEGDNQNDLTVVKEYDLSTNVKMWGRDGESVNFGIFPFYRIPYDNENFPSLSNRYVVMHNINHQGRMFDLSSLKFYKQGNKNEIEVSIANSTNVSEYYHVNDEFDYIQLCWNKGKESACGIVIPIFEEVQAGSKAFAYGIDFGTTNTHVAYKEDGKDPASFGPSQITQQAAFINTLTSPNSNSCGKENAVFMDNEKRRFFPHVTDDSYTFPFRTTTIKQGVINEKATLFGHVAIGFDYEKNIITDGYETQLKWKLDNENPVTEIEVQSELFFEELMWMVKNHWMTSKNADKSNKPKVIITYPKAMTEADNLLKRWIKAYKKVFECDETTANEKVDKMVESLAPCYKKISTGGVGAAGILNLDIGGGTTDMQYYRKYAPAGKTVTIAYYNSVLFAGDDLWGASYENVYEKGGTPKKVMDGNNFIEAAKAIYKGVKIHLGTSSLSYEQTENIRDYKERIGIFLRDTEGHFSNKLSSKKRDDVCRKTMFLHYTALIYYSCLWMRDNGMDCPGVIQFTGLGSKYIQLLFGDDTKLTKYTKNVVEQIMDNMPSSFKVETSEDGENPKSATAEGAALMAMIPGGIPKNEWRFHCGIKDKNIRLKGDKLSANQEAIMESLNNLLKLYKELPEETDDVVKPQLTQNDIEALKSKATEILAEMVTCETEKYGGDSPKSVNDPMFFWPLKGSLCSLT